MHNPAQFTLRQWRIDNQGMICCDEWRNGKWERCHSFFMESEEMFYCNAGRWDRV